MHLGAAKYNTNSKPVFHDPLKKRHNLKNQFKEGKNREEITEDFCRMQKRLPSCGRQLTTFVLPLHASNYLRLPAHHTHLYQRIDLNSTK